MNNTFFNIEKQDTVAVVTLDVQDESMNVLNSDVIAAFPALITELKQDSDLSGVVICSGKLDSFIAGADVKMLDACKDIEEAKRLSKTGHDMCQQIEDLPVPVVAAIHGVCLGGGLELALACDYRVCSDDNKTMLGLPEVQLGLLPGSGGTQRLPKLVGIQKALDMMLTGKQLRAKQAKRAGLVDDMVPNAVLLNVAKQLIAKGKRKTIKVKHNLQTRLLETNPFGRKLIFNMATKQVLKKTQGNYPAPEKIIVCVNDAYSLNKQQAFDNEASRFAELVMTNESKQLRNIFFATTEMKKEVEVDGESPRAINNTAVLGGGLMGGGIAYVTANKAGLPVRIKDISHKGIGNALAYSYKLLKTKVKRRHIRRSELEQQMAMLTGSTDYSGFKNVDIVVEAVFEDLDLKQQMVSDIETACHVETVFATNTSSLPISQIAAKASKPENIIGLHYFSPVDKMPLVEVIAHDKTSASTIATTMAFARKQGKTPVVVKDAAGFFVNRILAPYINEAAFLLLEGEPVDVLDSALLKFGFPVGPMTLLDEVGIDIGTKVATILTNELGDRFTPPQVFSRLIDDKRLGKKTQKGFYLYGKKSGKGKKQVDDSVYKLINIEPETRLEKDSIAQRCILPLLNEAARCLDDEIVAQPRDGDIAAIFGIGFPPFLGGPYRYMDTLGIDTVVKQLQALEAQHGERFAPCEKLLSMASSNTHFYAA